MTYDRNSSKNAASFHTQKAREQLETLIKDLREGVTAVDDLQAQALFETAAEVLDGLQRAFRHYEGKREEAWKE